MSTPRPFVKRWPHTLALQGLLLLPLAWLPWRLLTHDLGANPIEALIHATGQWTLWLLLLTLALGPVAALAGWRAPFLFRRQLGLTTFLYAMLHASAYMVLDQFFWWAGIVQDIVKRPFITLGLAGLVILAFLALISLHSLRRRLGARRWRWLQQSAHLAALLGLLHYAALVRVDHTLPVLHGLLYGLILLLKGLDARRKQRSRSRDA